MIIHAFLIFFWMGEVMVTTGYSMVNRSFHWATFAVIPMLVGPAYLEGRIDFGVISQVRKTRDNRIKNSTNNINNDILLLINTIICVFNVFNMFNIQLK